MKNFESPTNPDLLTLLERLCEDRLSDDECEQLEQLVLSDPAASRMYLDYIHLHGALHWDVGSAADLPAIDLSEALPTPVPVPSPRNGRRIATTVAAICAIVTLAVVLNRTLFSPTDVVIGPNEDLASQPDEIAASDALEPMENNRRPNRVMEPVRLIQRDDKPAPQPHREQPAAVAEKSPDAKSSDSLTPRPTEPSGFSTSEMVAFVDGQIRQGWEAAGVAPTDRASDAEWVRRVYLDLAGHIPPAIVVEEFLADPQPNKREQLVNALLDDPDYVRHFATVWTNLLVGRSTERPVHRESLHQFLRRSFAANRPWSEVVSELVAAEGTPVENGAAGFLLAHLNNEAVPATAITARLFLCSQVQCTQCHAHPFNEADQNQFWELNSFFKQTEIETKRVRDRRTGQTVMQDALVSRPVGGPTLYENRRGVMQAAYPKFAGVSISDDAVINRREQLAHLMTSGERPPVARAMVNRMWSHFFGVGFTNPVDDMGPHNPPTHPQLLDRLAEKFVESGYDVKQLIRWICLSEAYQLSSELRSRSKSDPQVTADELDERLFHRMPVRPMTAEQLYDSLLVATKAHYVGSESWEDIELQRRKWLQPFVTTFDTEENDEATNFNGTIPQALMLMNSELVDRALSVDGGTSFRDIVTKPVSDAEKIRQLCLAALSREPLPRELSAARKMLRSRTTQVGNREQAKIEAFQDIFWAFLNSAEFVLIH
ncbi:DUF1553 domain-containing protein [Thalassoroseus pseudoceratinae]|uniref:DUF1553 domain-containing protein n=1 Tax=Thalassoroseus pseudoceratinae TaxID=2713176 RepID=UPI00141D7851|nr:DUF1553 domain-containing protein [Thalassoroseus pseudoceratinae]